MAPSHASTHASVCKQCLLTSLEVGLVCSLWLSNEFFPGCLPPRYNLQLIMFLLSYTQFVLACMGPWNHQHSSESTHHPRISLSLLLTLAFLSGLGNRQSIFSLYSFAALEYIMCEFSFFCLAHCIWFIYVVPKVVRGLFFFLTVE